MKRKKTKNFNYACPREFTTGRWRVHLVYPGEPRADGGLPKSENENPPCGDTTVEFYDTEDNGQFVASFHMNTLLGYPWNGMVGADLDGLEAHGFAYPLSTQAATDWLEGDDLAKVNAFLKETCKEVFGILPGADADGYSLSGEAKEAALSRFALPENRKAALDMIRKWIQCPNSDSALNMMNMVMGANLPKDFFDDCTLGDEEYGCGEEAHEMASARKEIDTQTETKDEPEVDPDKEVK